MEPKHSHSNGLGGLLKLLLLGVMAFCLIIAQPGWGGILSRNVLGTFWGICIVAYFVGGLIDKWREGVIQETESREYPKDDLPRLPSGGDRIPGGKPYAPIVPEEHTPKLRIL